MRVPRPLVSVAVSSFHGLSCQESEFVDPAETGRGLDIASAQGLTGLVEAVRVVESLTLDSMVSKVGDRCKGDRHSPPEFVRSLLICG
jgi:hypothetical protein